MELKEGMYVRTKRGIRKIDRINPRKTINMFYYKLNDDNEYGVFGLKDILKASHNIIDLIEEGDYVNGYEVDFVQNGYVVFNYNHPRQALIYPKDIKSIVTKEQFESMSYRVGE